MELEVADALAMLVDERDHATGAHIVEVEELARRIALEVGCDEAEALTIGVAARLHDVGKVAVPDAVLNKREPLTDDEWATLRRHPVVGAEVVRRIPELHAAAPLIRAHHERWDGRGYPDGLSGHEIPLGARVIAVADAFTAMFAGRIYRAPVARGAALDELRRCAGTQFDPRVVTAAERVLCARTRALAVA
jgi:putative nucleotidyltransferase with HDIG domain